MEKTFSFDKQLAVGDTGESDFCRYYDNLSPVKSKQDMSYDFLLNTGEKVELKTDTYNMEDTGNFFMEIFGDIEKSKMGGPWRAMQDSVQYFVYYFKNNKTFFWFDVSMLCNALDSIIAKHHFTPREIKNKNWITRGYLIPRELLKDYMIRTDVFNKEDK
jgi:hypothetical protein